MSFRVRPVGRLRAAAACGAWALAVGLLPGCTAEPVNGCDPAAAVDATGRSHVEIGFGGVHGYDYAPACLRVTAGTELRFAGPFEIHPLGAGRYRDGRLEADGDGPIRETQRGREASFVAEAPGAWGFFCQYHAGEGMAGAVFVE